VVTAVKKTEDQRIELESHMGLVGKEIDELEETVAGVKTTIEHRRVVSIHDKAHIETMLEELRAQIKTASADMAEKQRKCKTVQEELGKAFNWIRELRTVLEKEEVRERWMTQSSKEVNVETVLGCLTSVDASLTVLLSWQSSLHGFPVPFLSSLIPKHFPSPPLLKGFTVTLDSIEPDTSLNMPKTEREMRAQMLLDKRFLRTLGSRPMTRR